MPEFAVSPEGLVEDDRQSGGQKTERAGKVVARGGQNKKMNVAFHHMKLNDPDVVTGFDYCDQFFDGRKRISFLEGKPDVRLQNTVLRPFRVDVPNLVGNFHEDF